MSFLYRRLRFSPVFFSRTEKHIFHRPSARFFGSNSNSDDNGPPLVPQPRLLDKYLVPVTVMATGAILSPGIRAMLMKPAYFWFYRRFYDWQFDENEFLTGARRALYFVTEKAFRKDFYGLKDVLTPKAMQQLRESVKDDAFRHYLNLGATSTPILYERIQTVGFLEVNRNVNENEHIQYYGENSSDSSIVPAEYRFEIFVFFVCKIERLMSAQAKKIYGEDLGRSSNEVAEVGVKNYTRLLVMMTFSRLLERQRQQSSDWLVSSLALVPLQFTFTRGTEEEG